MRQNPSKTMKAPAARTVDALLKAYPDAVRLLAADARRLIRTLLPKIEEHADSSAPIVAYGYGPGYRGLVCTLILSKSGVKLGLVRGGELADPHRLLGGSGKVHRHIALRTPEDLCRPGVRELIKDTDAAWRERTGADSDRHRNNSESQRHRDDVKR
jgi:hypothetical protein